MHKRDPRDRKCFDLLRFQSALHLIRVVLGCVVGRACNRSGQQAPGGIEYAALPATTFGIDKP